MNRVIAALCCTLVGCTMTTWRPAGPLDIKEGSELFMVETDRAVQVRNAHPSGDRVQGDVVHAWQLPSGGVHVAVVSGDEPADIARRGGWQEDMTAPATYVGNAADIERIRVTQDSHVGRFVLEAFGGLALIAGGYLLAAWLGSQVQLGG